MGSWLVFDDDAVDSIKESDIPKYFGESNSGSAYVLYYQAVDIDLAGLGLRIPPAPELSEQLRTSTTEPPASPLQPMPALPPGLVEENESLDISDHSHPISPSPASLPSALQSVEKESAPRKSPSQPLKVNVAYPGLNSPLVSSAVETTPGGASSTSARGGLFQSIRRTPSGKVRANGADSNGGPDHRRSYAERSPLPATSPSVAASDDHAQTAPVPPLPVNGKEKAAKEPERKPSTWFKKRKSIKAEKSRSDAATADQTQSPLLRGDANGHSPSSSAVPAWFRTSGHSAKLPEDQDSSESRNPDGRQYQSSSAARPHTSAGLSLKPPDGSRDRRNGYESPSPGSASSSLGSVPAIPSTPPLVFPSQRSSSLAPVGDSPRRSEHPPSSPLHPPPAHKKSLSQLVSRKSKKGDSPSSPSVPQRPSTAGPSSTATPPRPLPPIPPLPSSPFVAAHGRHMSNGNVPEVSEHQPSFAKGKSKAEGFTHDTAPQARPRSAHVGLGLGSFVNANHSGSTTSSASSNLKRATRKLSLTAPMLGFGRKEKQKDKDKDKGPPSSFSR